MRITIDQIPIEVKAGTTIMEAASSAGIVIPSMCYLPGFTNHPSCMVCLVKNEETGMFFPSCAMPVSEGMRITTSSDDVIEARREALELLLSDHVGDCEAPCRRSCPAFMDIPLMNRLIAAGNFESALKVVREEIALPYILGYICPAPCEKACHRAPLGGAVSICLLKRSTVQYGNNINPPRLRERGHGGEAVGKKVAIIGTGPAGLSAAFYLQRFGCQAFLFDKNDLPGGTLRYDIPDDQLPKEIIDQDIEYIKDLGAVFRMNTTVTEKFFEDSILKEFDAVVIATGRRDLQPPEDFGFDSGNDDWIKDRRTFSTSRPGVFVCGNIIHDQRMAVRSVAQGKRVAMAIGAWLSGRDFDDGKFSFHSVITHLASSERDEYMKESIPGDRRIPEGGPILGFTAQEAIEEAQRCLHCDCRKPATCKLRIYSDLYQANRKRFAGPERKNLTRQVQHETVIYEPEKCIRCGLCVEIAKKEEDALGLTFVGRGFDVRIGAPFNETIRQGIDKTAKRCVDSCPTGALAFKKQEERYSYE